MGIDSFKTGSTDKRQERWSKEEIIEGIQKLSNEKESTPTLRQAINCDYLPSNSTIRDKFGTWNNALDEAGFNVNEKHGHELDDEHTSKTESSDVEVFKEVKCNNSVNIIGNHTNKSKGEATEAIITGELLRRNINVLEPYGEDQRYDIVIDVNSELLKVQCKKGTVSKDKDIVKFSSQSSSIRSDGYEKKSYNDNIDYFAVYSWELDELFIVDQSQVADTTSTLRLTKPDNNQVKGITFAAEHTIDSFVDNITENTVDGQ